MESARVARGRLPGQPPDRPRLAGSYPAAVSLGFLCLALYLLLFAAGAAAVLLCEALLPGETPEHVLWAGRGARCLVVLLALVLFAWPLRLGCRGWYFALDGSGRSPRAAFACFAGPRAYFSAVWYGLVRRLAGFLSFFLPLLPALVIAASLRAAFGVYGRLEGGVGLLLLVLLALLTVAALCFGAFLWLGLFLADYRYAQGERNPFRALRDSGRLVRGGRARLALRLLRQLPWVLLFLLAAPIPFAAPKMESALAQYARDMLPDSESKGIDGHVHSA